jgi:hypothetical protein
MNSVMAINSESIPIPIPTPTPRVARIRPAVQGRPKPRLLGAVDYLMCWMSAFFGSLCSKSESATLGFSFSFANLLSR